MIAKNTATSITTLIVEVIIPPTIGAAIGFITLMRRHRSPATDLTAKNQKGRDHHDGYNREETIDVIERKHACLCLHRFVDHSEAPVSVH
jgi:hypothetical protein